MTAQAKRKPLILPSRRIILPNDRRKLPRPAPWIWVPKRFAPRMAVSFVTSGVFDNGASSVSTVTHTFNIGTPSSNGALVALLFVGSVAITSPTMTWNGVSMLLIPNTQHFVTGIGTGTTVLFGLVNPASGSNSMVASWTGANVVALAFMSFAGADQSANSTTFINGTSNDNGGTTSTQNASVTTASGDATSYFWAGGVSFSGTQTPTQDFQNNGGGSGFNYQGQHILSSSTSDSYSVALSGTDWISGSGCHIKASAGADVLAAMPQLRFM